MSDFGGKFRARVRPQPAIHSFCRKKRTEKPVPHGKGPRTDFELRNFWSVAGVAHPLKALSGKTRSEDGIEYVVKKVETLRAASRSVFRVPPETFLPSHLGGDSKTGGVGDVEVTLEKGSPPPTFVRTIPSFLYTCGVAVFLTS